MPPHSANERLAGGDVRRGERRLQCAVGGERLAVPPGSRQAARSHRTRAAWRPPAAKNEFVAPIACRHSGWPDRESRRRRRGRSAIVMPASRAGGECRARRIGNLKIDRRWRCDAASVCRQRVGHAVEARRQVGDFGGGQQAEVALRHRRKSRGRWPIQRMSSRQALPEQIGVIVAADPVGEGCRERCARSVVL